jgi:hypothetical protein
MFKKESILDFKEALSYSALKSQYKKYRLKGEIEEALEIKEKMDNLVREKAVGEQELEAYAYL